MRNHKPYYLAACITIILTGCSSPQPSRDEATQSRDHQYSIPYEAVQDTDWRSHPDQGSDPMQMGAVKKGTRTFLRTNPVNEELWAPSQFEDGSLKWIRPKDFRKVAE